MHPFAALGMHTRRLRHCASICLPVVGIDEVLAFSPISLALYGLNVAIIYLVGILFYKIKARPSLGLE